MSGGLWLPGGFASHFWVGSVRVGLGTLGGPRSQATGGSMPRWPATPRPFAGCPAWFSPPAGGNGRQAHWFPERASNGVAALGPDCLQQAAIRGGQVDPGAIYNALGKCGALGVVHRSSVFPTNRIEAGTASTGRFVEAW